jgi:RIO-like serine/threonine protein kinase
MHKKEWVEISKRDRTSTVWLDRSTGLVFKSSPKFLLDNEVYFLTKLSGSGYVPTPVTRHEVELISMPYIENEPVTDAREFMKHLPLVMGFLMAADCRHGDLTEYAVRVSNNRPILIDFGESRPWFSPLPDKRREGDRYWLTKTMEMLIGGHNL